MNSSLLQQKRAEPARHVSVLTRLRYQIWEDRWKYLFLAPFVVMFTLYVVWPTLSSLYYSLLDWNGFDRAGRFVGVDNYVEVVRDPFFWSAFKNTFVFMLFTTPTRVLLALVLAVILNDKHLPFARLFRTAIFLPVVTTMAIIGVIMVFVFDPVGGPVNKILLVSGLIPQPVDLLGRSATALPTTMAIHVWKWLGITLIYWLAALQTIPEELYEAARVDGASPVQVFLRITVPLLIPFFIIISLLEAVFSLRVFALIMTLTGGGPFFATEVMEIYIYRYAFSSAAPRLGYASAAAVFFGLATVVLAVGQGIALRRMRRRV